ncbi:MAG: anhydro-N-acetylmuramic acid kinase [Bacteroidota bacterium]
MRTFKVLGMMSGTSLDGLDLAYCQFWEDNAQWHFEIRQCTTIPYSEKWHQLLQNAIHLSQEDHEQLHQDYGKWLGRQAQQFLKKHDLQVDFLASHGHTSHHRPEEGVTFQLGHGQQIATITQQKVICDFRSLDVHLGGQGAPLVPIGDALLLKTYDFCLNLGGISNVSFQKAGKRLAYDIGMANMPLNHITQKIGLPYDDGGKLAATGILLPELYEALNQLPYYQLPYPKSVGFEWFIEQVQPLLDGKDYATKDALFTVIQHNCDQIARGLTAENPKKGSQLLVTGGGALNDFFIETLQKAVGTNIIVVVPPKKFIAFKEAMVFAFMGVLKYLGRTNVLASVTGANADSCSGIVFDPVDLKAPSMG